MAFEAGAITGRIDLDTESFNRGIDEAHTHTKDKGSHIREVFESINASLSELSPALAEVGEKINSVFAGFSEGKWLGGFNALMIGAGALREAVASTGERFDEMNLAAERAGVGVHFLSTLGAVGETVGLGVDQLTMSFRMLEQTAADAADGTSKSAAAAFNRIHISASQLTQLMEDPEKLFTRVQDAIQGETNASLRAQEAHDLLGRSGQALIPLLRMSSDEYQEVARNVNDLNVVMTDANAKQGEAYAQLTTYLSDTGKGIINAFSAPILEQFRKHEDSIVEGMKNFQTLIVTDIPKALHALQKDLDYLHVPQAFEKLGDMLQAIRTFMAPPPDEDIARGFKTATDELGYNPLSKAGQPIAPLPANLMPHLTNPNWHQGTDTPAGLAAIIQSRIAQQQPAFQRVLADISLQTAAGPGVKAPALPAVQGQLHSIMVGLGPAFDRALAGQDAGIANNPAFDAATKSLSEFSSAVLAANARLGQLSDVHHPAFNLGGLATIASPAIGELFGSVAGVLSQNFGALAASMQPAIEGLHRMVEAVTDMGRWRGPASPVLGPPSPTGAPTPSVGAANVTLNAPLTAMVDGRETANILANRFLPQIQRAIDQHKQQLAGAAQSAILNQTMGGG